MAIVHAGEDEVHVSWRVPKGNSEMHRLPARALQEDLEHWPARAVDLPSARGFGRTGVGCAFRQLRRPQAEDVQGRARLGRATFLPSRTGRDRGARVFDVVSGSPGTGYDHVEAEGRELVRRRGLDPMQDCAAVRRLVDEVVSDYDERALSSTLPPLSDARSAARAVSDAVAGFGPPQRHLDDPELEELCIY